MVAKSFAYGVMNDNQRRRHLEDLTTLSMLIQISDRVGDGLNRKENGELFTAYSAALSDPLPTDRTAPPLALLGCVKLRGRIWWEQTSSRGSPRPRAVLSG